MEEKIIKLLEELKNTIGEMMEDKEYIFDEITAPHLANIECEIDEISKEVKEFYDAVKESEETYYN